VIYTYEISLNGSDYLTLVPTNHPKITTNKMANEFIWRSEIDKIKINESLNASVYATLESWFTTAAAFGYTNKIRVKKSGTVKYTYKFGIKQGEVNYENKYYEIEPEPFDVYTDLLYYKERETANALSKKYFYNDEDDTTPEEIYDATMFRYEDWADSLVTWINTLSAGSDYSVQSAFLWNDNYPDETSSGATNYVSSDVNYLNELAIGRDNSTYSSMGTIALGTILDIPKQFQCFWHVASDYTIHLEHVSWYEDQIADYQLDITGSDYYDDARILKYSKPEIFGVENFFFPTDNAVDDYDGVQILYDPETTLFRNDKVDVRSEFDAYITSDFSDLSQYMCIGASDLVIDWRSSTFDTWVHDGAGLDGADISSGTAAGAGEIAFTNYLSVTTNATINYVIDVTYDGIPSNTLTMQGANGNTPVGASNSLGGGEESGTLTGNNIRIISTGAEAGFTITIRANISGRYRIPWETGQISSDFLPNNYLSWANNINRFWKSSRYAETGYINDDVGATTFTSTKFNKEQDTFSFYYATDIDPMRGIKTDYGTGMIQSYTRDLETDWIKVKLRYNE